MKDQLLKMNMLYLAQVMTVIAFSGVVLFLNYSEDKQIDEETARVFQYPLSIVFILGLAASQLIPRFLLKRLDKTATLEKKLAQYTTILLIRAACLELPGLLTAVIAFISGQILYLWVISLLLLIFLLYWPTKKLVGNELDLSVPEREQL